MKSASGKVIYVGKAKNLKKRVKSYTRSNLNDEKTYQLVENISDIDHILCSTQAQALILESALISEYKPKYNIVDKDDKSRPYIVITKEKFPRIYCARKKDIKNKDYFYGPYMNVKVINDALTLIRRIFAFRSCKKLPKKECLYSHLGLCAAPCAGKISATEYRKIVSDIKKILKGKRKSLFKSLENEMKELSKKNDFEKAVHIRDTLFALKSLYQGKISLPEVISLKGDLNLEKVPLHIEAVDISNLSGREAVGSLVVFMRAKPDKSQYRKFKIKTVIGPDDCNMVAEVVKRRFTRLVDENKPMPDLLLIDGGIAQTNAAFAELEKLSLKVDVIGLAKKNEEIWRPFAKKPIILPRDNPGLQLLQRIRDEAHRFAHKFHSVLRKKKLTE